MTTRGKIAVAMSGGVDSSVAAYLLQRMGYDVYAIFITILNPAHIPCTANEDKLDAMRAASALRIPFLEYDATELYREKVIENLVNEYAIGNTPNPDILCNSFVKFGGLWKFLQKKGFEKMATGHYADVREINKEMRLYRSADEDKDQTYFIYTIASEMLQHTLFPLGHHTKTKVRQIATNANLPAAQKPDSTGLCFLGDVSMKDFLSAYLPLQVGEVRHIKDDTVLGTHQGAELYTTGQRQGITLYDSAVGPIFVCKKDIEKNIVWVSQAKPEISPIAKKEYKLRDIVMRRIPNEPLFGRYRHRGELCEARYMEKDKTIVFAEPRSIATGQSIVLYTKDRECIGGGVVDTDTTLT